MKFADWKNPDSYPDPKTTANLQWAWEFLRRNIDYQIDYELHGHKWTPTTPLPKEIQKKYRIEKNSALPDPTNSKPYKTVFFGGTPDKPESRIDFSLIFWGDESGYSTTAKKESETTIAFDLEAPLQNQLARAKKNLTNQQKAKGYKFRARTENYRDYLRVLDAIADSVSIDKIASELFPKVENAYPYYKANDKVKKMLLAAEEMRDQKFYLLGSISKDEIPSNRTIKILPRGK